MGIFETVRQTRGAVKLNSTNAAPAPTVRGGVMKTLTCDAGKSFATVLGRFRGYSPTARSISSNEHSPWATSWNPFLSSAS